MTSTSAHTSGPPALDHCLELLRRPDGTVQLGWGGPDTGALVVPPEGIDAFDLLTVLRMLDGRHPRERVLARITERGVDAAAVDAILDELVSYGGALRDPARTGSDTTVEPRVRIHGDGPLADAIAAHLGGCPRCGCPGPVRIRRPAMSRRGTCSVCSSPTI